MWNDDWSLRRQVWSRLRAKKFDIAEVIVTETSQYVSVYARINEPQGAEILRKFDPEDTVTHIMDKMEERIRQEVAWWRLQTKQRPK